MSANDICVKHFVARFNNIAKIIKYVKEKYDIFKEYQIIRVYECDLEVEIAHMCDLDLIENALTDDDQFKDCFVRINLYRIDLTNNRVINFEIMKKNMLLSKD